MMMNKLMIAKSMFFEFLWRFGKFWFDAIWLLMSKDA